jgi:putative colanic acid biosynthesis UDP-glucose lipid carrier transferase
MQPGTFITTPRRWSDFVHPLLDAASVLTAWAIVRWSTGRDMDTMSLTLGLIAVVVFLLFSQVTGLQRRGDVMSADREISRIVVTWLLTLLALAMLAFVTRGGHQFSRAVVLSWGVVAPAVIGLQRMCVRIVQQGLLRRGIGIRTVAIAGYNALGRQTCHNLVHQPSLGFRFAGFYDDRTESRELLEPNEETPSTNQSPDDYVMKGDLRELVLAARG